MDPALVRIAEAAEGGQPIPKSISLFVPSGIISGQPISRSEYLRLFELQIAWSYKDSVKARRREKEAALQSAEQRAKAEMGVISSATVEGEVIHLGRVTMGFVGSGLGLAMQTIRVDIAAVSSWFSGDYQTHDPKQGGGWFVGGFVTEG